MSLSTSTAPGVNLGVLGWGSSVVLGDMEKEGTGSAAGRVLGMDLRSGKHEGWMGRVSVCIIITSIDICVFWTGRGRSLLGCKDYGGGVSVTGEVRAMVVDEEVLGMGILYRQRYQ